ncbi:hypothetical protein PBS_07370 [Paraburkholderia sp. 2C]
MHVVDELIDELIVLLELIGQRERGRGERYAHHPYRDPADQPQQAARYVGAIHLVMNDASVTRAARKTRNRNATEHETDKQKLAKNCEKRRNDS